MSIIIINRARVLKQLEVIDDPAGDIYPRLTPEQKDQVELIRGKGPDEVTRHDWHALLDICKHCP